jgi:starch-binding outer membrane protein, SusD/RagB family
MKKYISLFISILVLTLYSCDYLNVVPKGQATLDDLFKSSDECQKFVYYMYSQIPTHGWANWQPDLCGGDDMMTGPGGSIRWYPYKSILYGVESPSTTYFGMWDTSSSSPTGRTNYDLYKGIRYCYLLLNNINKVPDITAENYNYWRGEAYFLIGLYHQELLMNYGPCVLVKNAISIDASDSVMFVARSPYDSCVNFISECWDKAAKLLPARWPDAYLGRATSIAARAYKARLLLTAASPMFNGNATDYSNFVNNDGTSLMNLTYDKEKWAKALAACKAAIDSAEANSYCLYTSPSTTMLSTFDQGVKNYHGTFCETTWNKNEFLFCGASQSGPDDVEQYSAPRQYLPYSSNGFRNYLVPTFEAVEMYYSKNGLPMDVDPATKNLNLYSVATGDSTALLNRNREPRFYANVGYDRGSYDINGTTEWMHLRGGELQGSTLNSGNEYQSCSGYLNKKFISKQLLYDKSTNTITFVKEVFPYIRLAELYESYAEADFEYNGKLSDLSLTYLNKVRTRCGLPNFQDSWAIVGGIPTGDELRDVLHQERSIEFLGEGMRYYDLRRWREAKNIMNNTPQSWNLNGKTQKDFYKVINMVESGTRIFVNPKNTWLAIPLTQIEINPKLVQNPGY